MYIHSMSRLARASIVLAAAFVVVASQHSQQYCRGQRVCTNDEPTALVQKNMVLHKRIAGDKADPAEVAQLVPKIVQPAAMAGAAEHGPQPGLDVEQGTPTTSKARSTTQTIVVCVVVLFLVTISWTAYWITTENSLFRSGARLPLLIMTFILCYWALNVVDQHLMITLKSPMCVTCGQMLLTAAFCFIAAPRQLHGTTSEIAKWCVVPCIFFAMMLSALFTYEHFILLMLIRNIAPLMAMPLETLIMPADKHPHLTIPMVLALTIVAGSTLLYVDKFMVTAKGLGFAFLNVGLVLADTLTQRRLLTVECRGLEPLMCLFINNIFAIVPTMFLAFFWGEPGDLDMTLWIESNATALMVLAGLVGFCLSLSSITLLREISATSFMVLQNMVNVVVIVIGLLVFFDVLASPIAELGLGLSIAGAGWYGKTQLDGMKKKKEQMYGDVKAAMAENSCAGPAATMAEKSFEDEEEKMHIAKKVAT